MAGTSAANAGQMVARGGRHAGSNIGDEAVYKKALQAVAGHRLRPLMIRVMVSVSICMSCILF